MYLRVRGAVNSGELQLAENNPEQGFSPKKSLKSNEEPMRKECFNFVDAFNQKIDDSIAASFSSLKIIRSKQGFSPMGIIEKQQGTDA
jgi:hypothetical protein